MKKADSAIRTGAPVRRHERDGIVRILVGGDDKVWGLGVAIPLAVVRELLGGPGGLPGATFPFPAPGLF